MNKFNRVMPREGSVETILDRLYEYINSVDSNWIKNIKPASFEDINNLKNISGLKNIGLEMKKIAEELCTIIATRIVEK